jgi:hypothetical protein
VGNNLLLGMGCVASLPASLILGRVEIEINDIDEGLYTI